MKAITCNFYLDNGLLVVYNNGEGIAAINVKELFMLALIRWNGFDELKKDMEAYKAMRDELKTGVEFHLGIEMTERELDDLLDHCNITGV